MTTHSLSADYANQAMQSCGDAMTECDQGTEDDRVFETVYK